MMNACCRSRDQAFFCVLWNKLGSGTGKPLLEHCPEIGGVLRQLDQLIFFRGATQRMQLLTEITSCCAPNTLQKEATAPAAAASSTAPASQAPPAAVAAPETIRVRGGPPFSGT